MRIWRLLRRKWASAPLDGEGARTYGGRWNPVGVPMVYAATSLALAAMEMLVHVGPEDLPGDLLAIEIDAPGDVALEDLDERALPRDWRRYPPPPALAALGLAWVRAARTALLRVPSAVVPIERNVLVNPSHPAATRLSVVGRTPFSWDERLRRDA